MAAEQIQDRHPGLRDVHLDLALLERALAQEPAQGPPRILPRLARRGGEEQVQKALLGGALCRDLDRLGALGAQRRDRRLHEVAGDGVDIPSHVADLGELGCLDLDERRVGKARQATRDLGLSHTGGGDQDDVGGRHLPAQRLGQLVPPPAAAQGDRDGALSRCLSHDEPVELGDDLARRQVPPAHGTTSTVICSLV